VEHPARQLYRSPLIDPTRLTIDPDKLRKDVASLSAVHAAVKAGLEQAREAKVLGSSLQCSVLVNTESEDLTSLLREYLDEMDTMFVVSHVGVNTPVDGQPAWRYTKEFELPGGLGGGTVHVLPPQQEKCTRCWRYLAEKEGGLCNRCDDVVGDAAAAA
jgi:isoleucyl-tRNA synthetase